jgi:hypothetical protein
MLLAPLNYRRLEEAKLPPRLWMNSTFFYQLHRVENMFPLGIEPYLVGGIFVGLGVSLIYVYTGLHATQSSFFTTTLS